MCCFRYEYYCIPSVLYVNIRWETLQLVRHLYILFSFTLMGAVFWCFQCALLWLSLGSALTFLLSAIKLHLFCVPNFSPGRHSFCHFTANQQTPENVHLLPLFWWPTLLYPPPPARVPYGGIAPTPPLLWEAVLLDFIPMEQGIVSMPGRAELSCVTSDSWTCCLLL